MASKRRNKTKPAGEVYALGTKRSASVSSAGIPGRSSDSSYSVVPPKIARFTPEDSPGQAIDATRLIKDVNALYEPGQPQKVHALITTALLNLKSSRPRVPHTLGLALLNIARQHPDVFGQTYIVEQLCVLLKRDGNSRNCRNLHILVCNLLMAGLRDSSAWPPNLVKLYADDCLTDRSWVDKDETRLFVRNLETAFPNALRDIHSILPPIVSSQPPPHLGISSSAAAQAMRSTNPSGWDFIRDWSVGTSTNAYIRPRYEGMRSALEGIMVPIIREQLSRRLGADNHHRWMIRLIAMCAGFSEVRVLAIQKLDPWLQIQRLMPTAIALMKSICANCCTFSASDREVIHHVINKLRKLVTHNSQYYIDALRYLSNAHDANLPHMLGMVVANENSPTRNKNNPFFFPILVNFNTKTAYESLGDIFHDIIAQNDATNVRGLRQTYREICKWFRCDHHFVTGVVDSFLKDRTSDPVFDRMDRSMKDTYIYNFVDLLCVIQMNCAYLTSVRDSYTGKRENIEPLRGHYSLMRRLRQSMVRWFQNVLPHLMPGIEEDRIVALFHKAFFLGTHLTEDYFHMESSWPPEPDRAVVSSLCGDTPLTDGIVLSLLNAAVSPLHPFSPSAVLDILMIICQKAARVNQEIIPALKMTKVHDIIDKLYEAAQFPHPSNVNLPAGYSRPILMDRNLYWKVTMILVLLAAHNLDTLGTVMWKDYDTVRSLMEMLMTNNFEFPSQTLLVRRGMTAEDYANQERTVRQQERNMILDYESKITGRAMSERMSSLLGRAAHYLPKGPARPPPDDLLARLREWNRVIGLGRRLCTYRDFLLELIHIQRSTPGTDGQEESGKSWLVTLVEESTEASLNLLPIQCLSEYLIHDISVTSIDQRQVNKQIQLVARLRLVATTDPSLDPRISMEQLDMLQPFIDRLTWETERARSVARRCLREILSVDPAVTEKGVLSYLVHDLPSLPCYQSQAVREHFISRVHRAVLIETDQPSVVSYLTLLYNHASQEADAPAPEETLEDSAPSAPVTEEEAAMGDRRPAVFQGNPWSRLVDTLTRFLLSRPILFQAILQANLDAVRYMIDTFLQYLNNVTAQQSAFPVEENEQFLVVNFGAAGHCALSLNALHAQLFLLSQAALRPELADDPLFKQLLTKWFLNELGEMNSIEMIPPNRDGTVESAILPDYLKPHLLRSGVPGIVNKVVKTLGIRNILDLLPEEHVYAFPSIVMNIILHRADTQVTALVTPSPDLQLSGAKLHKVRKSMHTWLSSPAAVQYGMSFYRFLHELLTATEVPSEPQVIKVCDQMAATAERVQQEAQQVMTSAAAAEAMDETESDRQWQNALDDVTELMSLIRRLSEDEDRLLHSQVCAEICQRLSKRDAVAWFDNVLVGKDSRFLPLLKCLLTDNNINDAKKFEAKLVGKLHDHLKKLKNRSEGQIPPLWSYLVEDYLRRSEKKDAASEDSILPIDDIRDDDNDDGHLGALVDWLTLLDTETEESCQSPRMHESMFMEHGGSSKLFLSHRLHRCKLSSLQRCAESVLNRNPESEVNMDSSRVLDFIQASMDHPRLQFALTGSSPIFPTYPALELSRDQILHLMDHIERETVLLNASNAKETLSKIRKRIRLILNCCGDRVEIKKQLVQRLALRAAEKNAEAKQLLFVMYSECPALLTSQGQGCGLTPWLTKDHETVNGIDFLESDEIAVLGRNLLCALLEKSDAAQEDASMACKSLACHHPLVFCRHLPLMAGILQGRLDGTWVEFRRHNYHLVFSYIIHIVELMSPECFRTAGEEKNALNEILRTFLLLLKRYRFDKFAFKDSGYKSAAPLLKPMADKVVRVLVAYHRHMPSDFQTFVADNEEDLKSLAEQFPAISTVNALSKSNHTSVDSNAEGTSSATKMAPFVRKLRESTDQSVVLGVLNDMQLTSKRKPEILDHFVVDLQNLLSHSMTEIRELAFNLLGRYLNKHPECAYSVLRQSFLPCLCVNPVHPGVTESALKRLSEMLLLAPRLAPELMRAAAHLAVVGGNQTALHATAELVKLANLETLLSAPIGARSNVNR